MLRWIRVQHNLKRRGELRAQRREVNRVHYNWLDLWNILSQLGRREFPWAELLLVVPPGFLHWWSICDWALSILEILHDLWKEQGTDSGICNDIRSTLNSDQVQSKDIPGDCFASFPKERTRGHTLWDNSWVLSIEVAELFRDNNWGLSWWLLKDSGLCQ